MSKNVKDVDSIYDSYSLNYNKEDLDNHSGIKIKNSQTECYLKRRNDDDEEYWVRCLRVDNKIIEKEIVTEEVLLNRLNADLKNYVLI